MWCINKNNEDSLICYLFIQSEYTTTTTATANANNTIGNFSLSTNFDYYLVTYLLISNILAVYIHIMNGRSLINYILIPKTTT